MDMRKILVWGTGCIAREIAPYLSSVEVIGYIETKKTKAEFLGKKVYGIEKCPTDYDMILIAVSSLYHENIYYNTRKAGIDERKLCFIKKSRVIRDINYNLTLAKSVFSEEMYQNICAEFGQTNTNWIEKDAKKYTAMNTKGSMAIQEQYMFPIYNDKYKSAGGINSYCWQDLWAARNIFLDNPPKHYDIGSRLDGFITHLLSFRRNVTMIDIRPLDREIDGLNFIQSDATNLANIEDESIESLSALCSLEHFGLGRYGDPIDPEACYKCFKAIVKKMKPGGNIYISVPIGKEHIEFNAHRVFCPTTIIDEFAGCDLLEFSSTKDGYIEYNIDVHKYDDEMSLGGNRFGLFHLKKK